MKKLLQLQVIVLLVGTLFAWYTVITEFLKFYDVEGTIFRVTDCVFPNPVTTPCFWGAWAFLIALIWAYKILKMSGDEQKINQKRLTWLLIAGTIFAWSNNSYQIVKFYTQVGGEPGIGCSGQLITNPFLTSCNIGATIFLIALVVGFVIRKR